MENQTQPIQPQTPVQPATESFEPKKSLPKWPLIVVGVILLAVLLTGTYMLGKNQNTNQKPASKTAQTPTPTPTPNPTATWKTYTNSANLFTFRYPALFSVTEEIGKGNYTNSHNENVDSTYYNLKFSTGKIVNGQPDWSGFGVIVLPANGRTINQEYTGQQGMGAPIETTFTKETGGADEAADITNVENGVRVYKVGDKFFEIATFQNANLLSDGSDGITNDLLMNILSTIKFIR